MNRIKLKRIKKGLTQWRLSILTGISQSRISLFENGYVRLRPEDEEKLRSALKRHPRNSKNKDTSLSATSA
jgi:transcriptional regulator with XRE-family HTH domain